MIIQIIDFGSYSIKIINYKDGYGQLEEVLTIISWPPYQDYGPTVDFEINHFFGINVLQEKVLRNKKLRIKSPIEEKTVQNIWELELFIKYLEKQNKLLKALAPDDLLIVIGPANFPLKKKHELIEILKQNLNFNKIGYINSLSAISSFFDLKHAIVIDFGYNCTHISPVYEGEPKMKNFYRIKIGAQQWDESMNESLYKANLLPISSSIPRLFKLQKDFLKIKIQNQSEKEILPKILQSSNKNLNYQFYSTINSQNSFIQYHSSLRNSMEKILIDLLDPKVIGILEKPTLITPLIGSLESLLDNWDYEILNKLENKTDINRVSLNSILTKIISSIDSKKQTEIGANIIISGGLCNNYYFLQVLLHHLTQLDKFSSSTLNISNFSELNPILGALKMIQAFLNDSQEESHIIEWL